jgi:1-acyl-sn-glycerol-3-phosphate acyltransferase
MFTRLGQLWRVVASGFCFAVYGTLSFIASLTVLPLLVLWPGATENRERRIRLFVSWTFRALLWLIQSLGIGRVDVQGHEWLEQAEGKLVVATHPMYLDVVVLLTLMPFADCVVKSAMLRNPFYRHFTKAAGYISNANSEMLMETCVSSVQRGRTLVLFPEGTRSVPGETMRFRRGAAHVALRGECEILPVMIHCSPPALLKSSRWYHVPERPWRLTVRFYPPQDLTAFGHREGAPHGVSARHLTRGLEDFFKQQLASHEYPDRRTETAHHHLARS